MILKFLTGNWSLICIGLAVASFLGLATYANHEHRRAESWHAAHIAQKAASDAAQHSARAWALSAKAQQEARDAARKERSDESYRMALASDRSRANAYAAANRLRPCQVNPGSGGSANLPEAGGAAPFDNGPGGTSVMDDWLAVSQKNFTICTTNSRRIFNAHEWGLSGG